MLKKILNYQNKLTPKNDKLAHFFWGFWYAVVSVLIYLFLIDWIYIVIIPTVIISAIKEYYDSKGNGTVELLDFIFTIIPSIIFYIIL